MAFGRFLRGTPSILLAALIFSACGERIFYYPNRVLYADPHKLNIPHELVAYRGADGKKISGLYFPTEMAPKGVIVHFHGNFANVTNHFPQSYFLTRRGYDVLVFDYQGYGISEGKPGRKTNLDAGLASVTYAKTRLRNPGGVLGIFGQSLGAAVGAATAKRDASVDAVVLEAPFTSYRAIVFDVLKRHVVTWPLAFWYPWAFVKKGEDPANTVGGISPRPLLIIHGEADRVVPFKMGKEVFRRAREPKAFWEVPGADHLQCRRIGGKIYEDKIAEFFDEAYRAKNRI